MAEPRSTRFWIVAVVLMGVLVYALSFGPVTCLFMLLPQRTAFTEFVSPVYRVIYKPHLLVVDNNRAYFEYWRWWASLAVPQHFLVTWNQLQALKKEEQPPEP